MEEEEEMGRRNNRTLAAMVIVRLHHSTCAVVSVRGAGTIDFEEQGDEELSTLVLLHSPLVCFLFVGVSGVQTDQ